MFDAVPGQERLKELFARGLEDGTLSHAYLFSGPEGLGKTRFARELGVALVASCRGCGACAECERARKGLNPDLHVLEREGDLIRYEQVEPVVAELALKPFAAPRRVWIIPEVEQLHPAAANKLLKSIEEPPADAFFLLVTDRLERVLPTIVSRCRQVEFRPLSAAEVEVYLREQHGLDGIEAQALARLSGGAVERADRLAEDARGAGRRAGYLRYAAAAVQGGARKQEEVQAFLIELEREQAQVREDVQEQLKRRVAELEQLFQDERDRRWHVKKAEDRARREEARLRRRAAQDALALLAAWLRDLWVVACGGPSVLLNSDRAAELHDAAVATPEYYARLLAVAARARKDLFLNVDHKLALQAMFARFEEVVESA